MNLLLPSDLFRQVEAVLAEHGLTWYTDDDIYCHNCGRIDPREAGLLRDQPPAGYFDETEEGL